LPEIIFNGDTIGGRFDTLYLIDSEDNEISQMPFGPIVMSDGDTLTVNLEVWNNDTHCPVLKPWQVESLEEVVKQKEPCLLRGMANGII